MTTINIDKQIRIVQFRKLWGSFSCGNSLEFWGRVPYIYVTVAIPIAAGGPVSHPVCLSHSIACCLKDRKKREDRKLKYSIYQIRWTGRQIDISTFTELLLELELD